ncbi:thioesterase [Kineosporia sp. J2-2]|uniref:Thioesterase n=1 Tax=Kineosporia corallincola TaxID=2835133 RepID=A0ABS5TKY3_9ACTN|nr:thioesterase domain-containing protein [Kineosporia corallincola]MBT0771670.1 thioesterase [Kineosporia corallincola]
MPSDPWIRRFRPTSTATARLVCLPHAGGSASWYLPVASALSPRADVLAIQYPGRQDRGREAPLPDLATLADRLAPVLLPLDDLPLFLFGHSMGASLAFELTRRLEAAGLPVARLFVSGRRAPSVLHDGRVHLMDDAGLLGHLRGLDGTAPAVLDDADLMRAALPALRADYRAAELYRGTPGATVAAPVTALGGDADPETPVADVAAWSAHTTGGFELEVFPGGHFFVTGRAASDVLALLERRLHG